MDVVSENTTEDFAVTPPASDDEINGLPSERPHFLVFFFWDDKHDGTSLPEQNRAIVFDVRRN